MGDHYCTEHKEVFFMKGRMKNYAHPIGDTGQWCNEPEEGGDAIPEGTKTPSSLPDINKDIHRQVALKAAIELATHGFIKLHHVLPCSEKYRKYLDMELTNVEIYAKEEPDG